MFASRHTAEFSLGRVVARSRATPLIVRLRLALRARAQRRQLALLDAAALADIGVSAFEAQAEINRPAWDVPASWLR